MIPDSFCVKWSARMLSNHGITERKAKIWMRELKRAHKGDWHRFVIFQWGGEPVYLANRWQLNRAVLKKLVGWLATVCHNPVLVNRRPISDTGVQVWFASNDDRATFLLQLTDEAVAHRTLSAKKFVNETIALTLARRCDQL